MGPVCCECCYGFCGGTPLGQEECCPVDFALTPNAQDACQVNVGDLGLETRKRVYLLGIPHVASWKYQSSVILDIAEILVSGCCTSGGHLHHIPVTGMLIEMVGLCSTR